MKAEELKYLAPHFSREEIEATGAKLEDVNIDLMMSLVNYRKAICVPVWLAQNGLTTGHHSKDSYHYRPEGAVDFYHTSAISADRVVEELLRADFTGIGVYWNGSVRSFHADRRPKVTLWRGERVKGVAGWQYGDLVKVP